MRLTFINLQRDIIDSSSDSTEIVEEKPIAVQVVTIKKKTPLFKGEDQANSIEKIEIEENGFSLVSQKDLYQVGDKAVYIQPDYSLSDIALFDSFIRPNGEEKKSKLGSNRRIRAVKFNLHTGDNEPTYSVGILLPFREVNDYLNSIKWPVADLDLTKALGITKWEEPDNSNGIKTNGGREYPSTIYKTDETNINNLWGHIENKIGYPITLVGTKKTDGSSISLITDVKKKQIDVGSRKLIKSWKTIKGTGRRKPTFFERIRMFLGYWLHWNNNVDLLIKELVDNDDEFLTLSKPYIARMEEFYGDILYTNPIILRGEGNGQSWKGSGNKNNPDSKNKPTIKFFAVDRFNSNGIAVRVGEEDFNKVITELGFERCDVIFNKIFNSREDIEKECKEYFKTNMIEGIVVKTIDGLFSAKFMNDEYDSKK